MKLKKILLVVFAVSAFSLMNGCGASEKTDVKQDVVTTANAEITEENEVIEVETTEEVVSTEEAKEQMIEEQSTQYSQSSETTEQNESVEYTIDEYAGIYNDYDNDEPNLEIVYGEDGTYRVVIGIFRLAIFEDGVGALTEEGLEFTATDPAGNPIAGVITREGEEAVVTFTDSTWDLIENGTSYRYLKVN